MILAFCNQKGGVGKTTTAYHLARAAVLEGMKVLVVDADPQGNLTSYLTNGVTEDTAGLADAMSEYTPETITDVLVPGIWEGLTVVPTVGEGLGVVRDQLVVAGAAREARLREKLAPLRGEYDLIFIDCGPSLDQLVINALTAADGVVIVSESKLLSVNGLAKLFSTVQVVKGSYNPALQVAGLIVNQHEAQTVGGGHWAGEIAAAAEQWKLPLLSPAVPKRQLILDASESAEGLDECGPLGRELAQIYAGFLSALMKGK